MTYRLGPGLTRPYNRAARAPGAEQLRAAERERRSPAEALLDSLGIHDRDVEDVRIKEVTVTLTLREGGGAPPR
jgi:hypothetical protein